MTTIYKFKAYYTDSGVGAVQNPAPVISIVNMADDSLVATAQPTTASTNMPGLYSYEYSGADGLDLVAFFATTDTGCDVKQLASYVSEKITTNLNADVAGVEAKVDTIDDLVDDLETRLTAARAGYLDNLSGGAVALEATLTAIKGAGWTDETLVKIVTLLEAIPNEASVYDGKTYEELIKLFTSALLGLLSRSADGTTLTFRDLLDTKNRIITTQNPATGERTNQTLDGS